MIAGPPGPTIVIRKLPDGNIAINAPADKMLALSMLSVATAVVQRDILNPAKIIPAGAMPPPPPSDGKEN